MEKIRNTVKVIVGQDQRIRATYINGQRVAVSGIEVTRKHPPIMEITIRIPAESFEWVIASEDSPEAETRAAALLEPTTFHLE